MDAASSRLGFTRSATAPFCTTGVGTVAGASVFISSNLRSLHLDDNPIENLTPLGALTNLEVLSIARTQVTSLEALAGLSLQQLNICGLAVTSLQGVAAPRTPGECAHLWAEDVSLHDSTWATERDQLCSVGWAVRASRSAGADPVTCGQWCDAR